MQIYPLSDKLLGALYSWHLHSRPKDTEDRGEALRGGYVLCTRPNHFGADEFCP